MHANQLTVSLQTVRELVDEQFPEWRSLPVRGIASQGTVNAIFRIGDELAARFPLEPRDVESTQRWLETEADAARELIGRTRFPTPEPVALGEPGAGYPLPWSVQTWLPGIVATDEDPGESVAFAHDLAEFIDGRTRDRHARPDVQRARSRRRPEDPTTRGWRPVSGTANSCSTCARLRRMWTAMRTLPRGAAGDVMTHGDLIPGNVLVSDGRLAGILDVGGLGPADPALDLVAAWHLLEAGPRQALRADLGCDDLEWERGKAWAFAQAMGAVWYYVDSNPAMSRMGRRTLDRIMADGSSA